METEDMLRKIINSETDRYVELYNEICYLRYLLSVLVESDEKFKSVINQDTFLRAKIYASQECNKKLNSKMEEMKGENKTTDETVL